MTHLYYDRLISDFVVYFLLVLGGIRLRTSVCELMEDALRIPFPPRSRYWTQVCHDTDIRSRSSTSKCPGRACYDVAGENYPEILWSIHSTINRSGQPSESCAGTYLALRFMAS